MLTTEQLRVLADAYRSPRAEAVTDALADLGNPTEAEIIPAANAAMLSADRNVRVVALRVLARQNGPEAMCGVLRGLNDAKRRVRSVAIKTALRFCAYPEIVERLAAIATDPEEINGIREGALAALTAADGDRTFALEQEAAQALASLAQADRYRSEILFGLVRLELTDQVRELLEDFVANGNKDEAVMATKALCGYRVIHLGAFWGQPEVQRQIKETCELAQGRVWYWMRREEYAGLLAAQE